MNRSAEYEKAQFSHLTPEDSERRPRYKAVDGRRAGPDGVTISPEFGSGGVFDLRENNFTWNSGSTAGYCSSPLCFYYGASSPSDNVKLYKLLMNNLGQAVSTRLQQSKSVSFTGTSRSVTATDVNSKNDHLVIVRMIVSSQLTVKAFIAHD